MAECTSGKLTVLVLDDLEAEALGDFLEQHEENIPLGLYSIYEALRG